MTRALLKFMGNGFEVFETKEHWVLHCICEILSVWHSLFKAEGTLFRSAEYKPYYHTIVKCWIYPISCVLFSKIILGRDGGGWQPFPPDIFPQNKLKFTLFLIEHYIELETEMLNWKFAEQVLRGLARGHGLYQFSNLSDSALWFGEKTLSE